MQDLDAALEALGGERVVERGSGDDQETGGFKAAVRRWLPELFSALGATGPGDAAGPSVAPPTRHPEDVKKTSNFLRGTIAQGLEDVSTGALTYEDTLLTKFHGIYQQVRAQRGVLLRGSRGAS